MVPTRRNIKVTHSRVGVAKADSPMSLENSESRISFEVGNGNSLNGAKKLLFNGGRAQSVPPFDPKKNEASVDEDLADDSYNNLLSEDLNKMVDLNRSALENAEAAMETFHRGDGKVSGVADTTTHIEIYKRRAMLLWRISKLLIEEKTKELEVLQQQKNGADELILVGKVPKGYRIKMF